MYGILEIFPFVVHDINSKNICLLHRFIKFILLFRHIITICRYCVYENDVKELYCFLCKKDLLRVAETEGYGDVVYGRLL